MDCGGGNLSYWKLEERGLTPAREWEWKWNSSMQLLPTLCCDIAAYPATHVSGMLAVVPFSVEKNNLCPCVYAVTGTRLPQKVYILGNFFTLIGLNKPLRWVLKHFPAKTAIVIDWFLLTSTRYPTTLMNKNVTTDSLHPSVFFFLQRSNFQEEISQHGSYITRPMDSIFKGTIHTRWYCSYWWTLLGSCICAVPEKEGTVYYKWLGYLSKTITPEIWRPVAATNDMISGIFSFSSVGHFIAVN